MKIEPWNVIQELRGNNSRLFKEDVIKREMLKFNNDLFWGFNLAFDPLITFGVKQLPVLEFGGGGGGSDPTRFRSLAQSLENRSLTGYAARDAIQAFADTCLKDEWNDWYCRILLKDFACGVSERTINKIAKRAKKPQYQIKLFGCQLAYDSAGLPQLMTGVKQIETKLDGVRVLMVVHDTRGEKISMFSRNGKEFNNFGHVVDEMRAWLVNHPLPEPMVFDGEIMSSSFQDLMKQVHRKTQANASDAVLNLFDMLTLREFQSGGTDIPQRVRSEQLRQFVDKITPTPISIDCLSYELVDLNTAQGAKRFIAINKNAVDGGFEGVMIKDIDAPYVCDRSRSWLKAKLFIEVTLEVIALEEGTGRNQGRLGALVCEGVDDGRKITVNVGSGLSDTNRVEFWTNQKRVLGALVEVRADAVTQNQDGSYSLRFPRFKTFRGFASREKL